MVEQCVQGASVKIVRTPQNRSVINAAPAARRNPQDTPDLSVVLTIVDGDQSLARCLHALAHQTGRHKLEVLVPYDQMVPEAVTYIDRYPAFTFLDLGTILEGRAPRNARDMHRFYDARRAAALKAAAAPLVAIIEDRGIPKPDWSARMIELHRSGSFAAVGGAVENGIDRLWNWAVFFCDFGRYQPPLHDTSPEYVTDTNICYRREALNSVRHLWNEFYQESEVNWALRRNGGKMLLSDLPVTVQLRPRLCMADLAKERLHWGRVFGQVRGREMSLVKRMGYALASPVLPLSLFVRHLRRQRNKSRNMKQFLLAAPAMFLLLSFWSIGELMGYVETRPRYVQRPECAPPNRDGCELDGSEQDRIL